MSKNKNFLLGQGERLTGLVDVPSGGGEKNAPYDFPTARTRVATRVRATNAAIRGLPADACPNDEAVAVVTLHPRYVSKSDFPEALLREVGLRPIGSRPRQVKPEEWGVKNHPESAVTAAIFVAGRRESYEEWDRQAPTWTSTRAGADQLAQVEDLAAYTAAEKVRGIRTVDGVAVLELVLHAGGYGSTLDALVAYAARRGARLDLDRRRKVDDLWFVPASCPVEAVSQLAAFSFLRVVRGMPELRPLQPTLVRAASGARVELPTAPPLEPRSRVAVFDGGLPATNRLAPWVRYFEPVGIGPAIAGFEEHGLHVTSAALFGNLTPGTRAPRPATAVDHYRVLDRDSGRDPFNLVDVLDRIATVLKDPSRPYDFVNLSLGPNLAVEDDEVTLWTATLDELFATPSRLLTVAAGNGGLRDASAGLNRVQPPGDAVNALCVGAADSRSAGWARAPYSSVGPGRSPGVVKPDGLAFGGSAIEPFRAVDARLPNGIAETQGTSFAAPSVIGASAGVAVVLGDRLNPLAIRALLIHRAERGDPHSPLEAGWGRLVTDIDELITCGDDEAHVVYQGVLPVGQHLRALAPLPDGELPPKVEISATLCIAPQVDAAHPFAYTRSGLEVAFRPHSDRYTTYKDGKRSTHPTTESFFSPKRMYSHAGEITLREEGKWEPVLSHRRSFKAAALKEPCFDIYYHHRVSGLRPQRQDELPYALVVTVRSEGAVDLYNAVVRTYQQILQPIQPVVQVPIRT